MEMNQLKKLEIIDMGDVVISKRLSKLIDKMTAVADAQVDEMRRHKAESLSRYDTVKK